MAARPPKVGFIGTGSMGKPMANRILQNFELAVHNRTRLDPDQFGGSFEIVDSPAELASPCYIVVLCLPTIQTHRDVLSGDKSLLPGDRLRIVIHTGTTGPSLAREMEEALAARSMELVDAPISGGPERAARGDLVTMASGPEAALEAARPIIPSYSGKIVDFGPNVGSAQTMKLVNNVLVTSNLVLAAEAMLLGLSSTLYV